jgi:hypothetical protein
MDWRSTEVVFILYEVKKYVMLQTIFKTKMINSKYIPQVNFNRIKWVVSPSLSLLLILNACDAGSTVKNRRMDLEMLLNEAGQQWCPVTNIIVEGVSQYRVGMAHCLEDYMEDKLADDLGIKPEFFVDTPFMYFDDDPSTAKPFTIDLIAPEIGSKFFAYSANEYNQIHGTSYKTTEVVRDYVYDQRGVLVGFTTDGNFNENGRSGAILVNESGEIVAVLHGNILNGTVPIFIFDYVVAREQTLFLGGPPSEELLLRPEDWQVKTD